MFWFDASVGITISTSFLISNVERTTFTLFSFFLTYTSLILDVTNSPSNPLLISVCNLFHKLSNFYNEFPTSYYIFSLKLEPLL